MNFHLHRTLRERKWSFLRVTAYVIVVTIAAVSLYRAETAIDRIDRESQARALVTCERSNEIMATVLEFLEYLAARSPERNAEAIARARVTFAPRDCMHIARYPLQTRNSEE